MSIYQQHKKTNSPVAMLGNGVSCYSQTDVSNLFLVNNGAFNYDEKQTGNIAGDVIHEVDGWTNETSATYTVPGTFAYNAGVTFNGRSSALPITGDNGGVCPNFIF